jgi:cytochrome c553
VRPATVAAGALACAAAAMAVAAFTTGGGDGERAASAPSPAPAPAEPADPAAAHDGKAVWVAHGCGSCHSFAAAGAKGQFAPNLSATLKGMPASYIEQSILAPSAVVAPGFSAGMMPEDYAARMTRRELDALVEFIRSGVRN